MSRSIAPAVVVTAVSVFVATTAWLHVLRPDVDPFTRGMSRLAAGPHGTVASLGFAAFGLALR